MTDLLFCTVGGSPRPIAWSLAHHRPRRVVFFCSAESEKQLAESASGENSILATAQELGFQIDRECIHIVRVDHQDLVDCVEKMRRAVAGELAVNNAATRFGVDITGGTKVMSAALALVCQRLETTFHYVAARKLSDGSGAEGRSKQGVGVTLDGYEFLASCDNPWDMLGFNAIDQAHLHFNNHHFAAACDVLDRHRDHVTNPVTDKQLTAWKHLAEAYGHWDSFRYGKAAERLELCLRDWQYIAPHLTPAQEERVRHQVQEHLAALAKLDEAAPNDAMLLDFAANADRRARDGHFEDALIRLYRATEMAAQVRLRDRHGINDTGCVRAEKLAPSFIQEQRLPTDGRPIRLGIQLSYALLEVLGDDLGQRFMELSLDASESATDSGPCSPLSFRNASLLTHGFTRSNHSDYKRLRKKIMYLLQISEADMPAFPRL